jgi:hypothetical protein
MKKPTIYTPEIADVICEAIATNTLSLKAICAQEAMPSVATVTRWLKDNNDFRRQIDLAKELQADMLAAEILEIADDTSGDTILTDDGIVDNKDNINNRKLRVEARKWLTAKLNPRRYGSKPEITKTATIKKKQIFKLGDIELEF